MSKANSISKLIKLAAFLFAHIVKTVSLLIAAAAKTIFKDIGKRLRFSITFKTAVTYSLIFSTIFLVLSLVILSFFGLFLVYEGKNSLEKNARVTMNFLQEETFIPKARIQKFASTEGIRIVFMDQQKHIIYSTEDNANLPDNVITGIPGFNVTAERIYFSTRNQGHDEAYYILLSKPLIREIMYLVILAVALFIIFLLALSFMVTTGSRTLKKMLKPIKNMINTAKSISANRLHTRINVVASHDELKELAETFNEMLNRIQASYEQQNQFVSDASHELRTPISVIQGYANLLQRWGKEEKEVLEESLLAIRNEADNMKELVERLLFLARADKETQKVVKRPFSLNELIDEVVKETNLIDAKHEIISETDGLIEINGDRGLIKQALRIFLDNSVRYTPEGGKIKVTGDIKGNRVRIIVEDNGIGISNEDLPHVFNRFYKCDKSRTRESGGTGLGLSIAKWIIEKHNGTIEIESTLNVGTRIIISVWAG